VKDNVLPIKAEAMVNFRILPGDTIESVLAHMRRVINDKRVTVSKDKAGLNKNPSPISSPSSPGFAMVHRSVRQVFHNSIVTPGLVLGGTDSRHFVGVTKNIYRFLPIEVTSSDLKRIHGTGERITISNYAKSVKFYMQVMRNAK
jgi:carboxypeptidase PM20D1